MRTPAKRSPVGLASQAGRQVSAGEAGADEGVHRRAHQLHSAAARRIRGLLQNLHDTTNRCCPAWTDMLLLRGDEGRRAYWM